MHPLGAVQTVATGMVTYPGLVRVGCFVVDVVVVVEAVMEGGVERVRVVPRRRWLRARWTILVGRNRCRWLAVWDPVWRADGMDGVMVENRGSQFRVLKMELNEGTSR